MTVAEIFAITLYHGYIPQILIAEAMFTLKLERRSKFWLRFAVGLPIAAFLMIVLPNIIAHFVSGLFSINIFLLSLVLCAVLFKNKFSDILFCCVGAQLTQNLSYHIENLICLPFGDGISTVAWLAVSVASLVAVYVACYFAFVRKMRTDVNIAGGYVFLIAVVTALFVYVMQYLFQIYKLDRIWVTRLPLVVCCVFGLIMQFGLFMYGSERKENEQLEYFLGQERKQYEATKRTVELINMKAHDLKHHIHKVQKIAGDGEELDEIAEVIEEYEKTIDCGNNVLDVILTEKQYICNREGIDLSLMIQGEELGFMHTSDIVAVFGNALDNAIECEMRVEEKARRCIAVKVMRRENMLSAHFENYCLEEPEIVDGLPLTTKADKDYHGFGMKSIRYAVGKYGGSVRAGKEGNLFVLNILIPIPETTENK